jgi:hypothetical protein
MSKRPRRNHTPSINAKVALDALKGEQTLVEDIRFILIRFPSGRSSFLEHAADVFSKD